jgi:glycosyltransferase involved in cell wall biosynthesis
LSKYKILIILQKDPLGAGIGGINTFLRGFIKYAPEDFLIGIIGITTDRIKRPVGKWQKINYCNKVIDFFPVFFTPDQNKRSKIPLSFNFILSLLKYNKNFNLSNDIILEFHRIEPVYPFRKVKNLKVIFIHSNVKEIYNIHQESRWRRITGLYFKLEKKLIPLANKVFVVSKDSVGFYKKVFPSIENIFSFIPTWVDNKIFYPLLNKKDGKDILRSMFPDFTFCNDDDILLFAGRLMGSKNPLLLIDTFHQVVKDKKNVKLLIVGNGSLKVEIIKRIKNNNLEDKIMLVDILTQQKLARIMRACDVFVLTSAYEGMPRVVIESLASGTPVVSTDVGEVNLVVKNNYSGIIVKQHSSFRIARAILTVLNNKEEFCAKNCVNSVKDYSMTIVLNRIYKEYRKLIFRKNYSTL